MDCKVIPGECVVTQHKILVADFHFQVCVRRDRVVKITRTRWWKFKGNVFQVFKNKVIVEGPWNEGEDANNMWKEMTTHIRKVTIKMFGVTRGNKCESLSGGMMMYKRRSVRRKKMLQTFTSQQK
jgi:hypothetical protein